MTDLHSIDKILDDLCTRVVQLKLNIEELKSDATNEQLSKLVQNILTHTETKNNEINKLNDYTTELTACEQNINFYKTIRSLGYTSKEQYLYITEARKVLDAFDTKQRHMIDVACDNLTKLDQYNRATFRVGSMHVYENYIRRCEEYLKLPITNVWHNDIMLNSESDFTKIQLNVNCMHNILETYHVSTDYLTYVEDLILKAHTQHNYNLAQLDINNQKIRLVYTDIMSGISLNCTRYRGRIEYSQVHI